MNIPFKSRDFLTSFAARDAHMATVERSSLAGDEELVLDGRSERRPAEVVEEKLFGMLKGESGMISHMRTKRLIAHRS